MTYKHQLVTMRPTNPTSIEEVLFLEDGSILRKVPLPRQQFVGRATGPLCESDERDGARLPLSLHLQPYCYQNNMQILPREQRLGIMVAKQHVRSVPWARKSRRRSELNVVSGVRLDYISCSRADHFFLSPPVLSHELDFDSSFNAYTRARAQNTDPRTHKEASSKFVRNGFKSLPGR